MNALQRLAQLESFVQQDPDNLALLSDALHAALQAGVPERARALLERADPAQADLPARRHLEATLLLAERRYAEAAAVLDGLRAEGLDASGILFNLGYAQMRSGALAEAAGSLAPLLAREDAPEATLAWLMRSLHHAGSAVDAVAAWEGAPDRFRTPEATAVASLAYLDTEAMDEARRLSELALAQGASASEAAITAATVAIGAGAFDRAMPLLERARKAAPQDGRVWSTQGTALMARGDIRAAEEAFRQAVAFMPQHIGTWHALAWCQVVAGRLDDAKASFLTALELDRNFGETHGGLAVVHAMQGRVGAAREEIELAARLDRDGMTYRYAQALLAGDGHDPAAMRALASKMLRRRPGAAAIRLIDRLDG